jgi:hypothetical protein
VEFTPFQLSATLVIAIAGGSGVAAAINAFAASRQAQRDRANQLADREHLEKLAREERLDALEREREERYRKLRETSREAHLEEIADVVGLLMSKQAEHAEERQGLWVHHQPPAPASVPDWTTAISVLRRNAMLHNDPEVRTRCRQTVEAIESAWVETVEEPNIAEIRQWIDWLRESAELMHKGSTD